MNYTNINNKKLRELMKEDVLLIDIRNKDEYEEKRIQNSINIQLHDLLYNIDEIEEYKDKKVIIYCRSGHRSITACNLLVMQGFKHIYNLEKGIINYKL
ncbi:rhodanese-like domain-containing protein [Romboutsia sp.]|uniref:rhodanese-like domain-containing protein n=1 Tax=Romboutsia sp. TaxID=1965302 RepID=UPI002CBAA8D6|nr:rhodanese-like domain-containing protein [Romboutsia sp.]HSQ87474.1 rhodanese-like domain-containing protein [Romboutsia sp.]